MIVDFLISFVLGMIMFTIGSSLKPGEFRAAARRPNAVILGLSLQMLFLPLMTFALVNLTPLSAEFKIGLMILSFCPGGTTANLVSYLVKADVPLSIYLTSLNSFLILVTVPSFTYLALNYYTGAGDVIHLPVGITLTKVVFIILLPVLAGMWVRKQIPHLVIKLQRPLKYVSIVLLAAIFTIKFFAPSSQGGSGIVWGEVEEILPIALTMHILSMVLSYYLAKGMLSNHKACVTIGIEVGLQNTTLALLITSTILGSEEMAKPALVYALFSFFTTFTFGYMTKRFGKIHRLEQA
ncbi:MAG: bile acid:sodium symporter family protein [Bacteroidales bacterium]|nr:bile acid:sodium symporter family protein [Bacteroidales bacterium]